MYICWYMPIKSNQSLRDSDNFREHFFNPLTLLWEFCSTQALEARLQTSPCLLPHSIHHLQPHNRLFGSTAAILNPPHETPTKSEAYPSLEKKNGTIKVYILQSQTPTSTKWYSQLSHDPFTIQDAHAAGVLSWPSAWSPFFFTWESGNRACQIQRNKYVVFKTSSLPNGLAQPC